MQSVFPFTKARRLYSMNSWKLAAKRWLEAHPLCIYCRERGRITPATEVHHEPDHGGDWEKFWDRTTWRPACRPCHSRITQAHTIEKRTGKPALMRGCDERGWPIDPRHLWNQERSSPP
jgi:5-methylcytosine-specific restriction protein A